MNVYNWPFKIVKTIFTTCANEMLFCLGPGQKLLNLSYVLMKDRTVFLTYRVKRPFRSLCLLKQTYDWTFKAVGQSQIKVALYENDLYLVNKKIAIKPKISRLCFENRINDTARMDIPERRKLKG